MIEDIIRQGLLAPLEKFGLFEGDVDIELGKPRDRAHGDLSTNLAMVLAKRAGVPPRQLAEAHHVIEEKADIRNRGAIGHRRLHAWQRARGPYADRMRGAVWCSAVWGARLPGRSAAPSRASRASKR